MLNLATLTDAMNGNTQLVEKFLAIFKSQAPKQMHELKIQVDAQDWEAVSTTAHSLKTQFSYLSLTHLVEVMKQVEELADSKQTDSIPSLVNQADEQFLEVFNNEFPS